MMIKGSGLILLGWLVAGCASSHIPSQPLAPLSVGADARYEVVDVRDSSGRGVPDEMLRVIRSYLRSALSKEGLLAEKNKPATGKVEVVIVDYRMRTGFQRTMFGAMSGRDGIDSEVSVTDAATGELLGRSRISSYNVTAVGSESDIARMHGEEISKFLSGKK